MLCTGVLSSAFTMRGVKSQPPLTVQAFHSATVIACWPMAKGCRVTLCIGAALGSSLACPIMKLPPGIFTMIGQVGQSWNVAWSPRLALGGGAMAPAAATWLSEVVRCGSGVPGATAVASACAAVATRAGSLAGAGDGGGGGALVAETGFVAAAVAGGCPGPAPAPPGGA